MANQIPTKSDLQNFLKDVTEELKEAKTLANYNRVFETSWSFGTYCTFVRCIEEYIYHADDKEEAYKTAYLLMNEANDAIREWLVRFTKTNLAKIGTNHMESEEH